MAVLLMHMSHTERRKLDKKAVKLHFMGHADNAKGRRLLDEEERRILSIIQGLNTNTFTAITFMNVCRMCRSQSSIVQQLI